MLKRLLPIPLLLALALPVAAGAAPKAGTSVVGGQPALVEHWPSIAFLLSGWDADGDGEIDASAGCTGTVVEPSWVLTAAHCAFRPDGAPVDAMLAVTGTADVANGVGEVRAADHLVTHPTWNAETLAGDMLLMHLEAPSTRPAMPLARAAGLEGYGLSPQVPNAAGWGLVDEAATLSTDVLQEAFLEILDDATCEGWDPTYDASTQTCAFTENVAGVCRGDSGGPLTVLDPSGVPHLWGVTSYGTQLGHGMQPCALQAPAVFSWVPAFADWVDAETAGPVPPPAPPGPAPPAPPPPSPGPPSAPRDTTPPVLRAARLSAKRVRPARRGATIARKAGAKLTFTLSEAAAVRITVLNRRGRALSPSATIAGQAGRTTRRFTGRLGSKALKRGRYKLQLGAVDVAGNAARPVRIAFRIVR